MLRIIFLFVCAAAEMADDVPAHCVYGGWTAWGECTAPCAGGVRTRHRPLDTGTPIVHRQPNQNHVCTGSSFLAYARLNVGNSTNPLMKCASAQSEVDPCNSQMCTGG